MADEVSSFCNMTQTQADVQRNLLNSPELFATTGNPQTGNSSTITAGVRWSLSKHLQAGTVSKLADANCDSYRVDAKLAEQTKNVGQRADLKAIESMEPLMRQVLALANEEVKKEQALMQAKVSTLTNVKDAFDARDSIRTQLASLVQTRSRIGEQLPDAEVPLGELVRQSIEAKAEVANETSQLAAQSAWDVSIAAGAQNDPRAQNRTQPFVGLTVSYSFGAPAANRAANKVAGLTTQYLNEQRDGPLQQYQRAIATVKGLVEGERIILQGLEERKAFTDATLERLTGITTDDGQRAIRQTRIERLASEAQIAGSVARLKFLQQWIERNKPI
ncbi:hypothetical protein AWB78_05950 [Caballeronia calidae]|uniref:Outer membrane efflux protein n=2 Tax=Caballeronia calidae TaxID=1777139 RepID=A0A158E200_9BURK|nr:hypothetical protein AWB78_05950 [Caballeronia calidae]